MITSQQLIDWGKKNGKDVSGLDAKFGTLGLSKANSYWNKNNANHLKYINLFKDWLKSLGISLNSHNNTLSIALSTPIIPPNTPSVSLSALEAADLQLHPYAPYYTANTPGLSSYKLTDRNTYKTKDYSDVSGLYDYIVLNSTAGRNNPLATVFTQYDPDMFDGSITGRENFIKLMSDNGINNHLGYRDRGRLANFVNTMLHDRVSPMKDAESIWDKYKPLVLNGNTLSDADYTKLKTDLNGWKAKYYPGQKLVNTYFNDLSDNVKNIMSKIGGVYLNGSWYLKNGGMINYYQLGGAAQELDPQELIVALVLAAMQGDEKATLQIKQIQAAAEQGDKSAAQIMQYIQQIMQQMLQQTQSAKRGAKLQYLALLRGECPEGTHMEYFKAGGLICKKCILNKVQEDKCGGKAKKQKMACGGATKTINSIKSEMEKCGGKIKKKMNKMLHGGSANTAPDTIIRAKMTPEARRRRALRFKKAWELARAEGALTFKFEGDSYSTKKKGESDKYWAKHFKDKTTVSGQHNVLSNVAYGWEGVPGASPGYFDSNGKFVKLIGNPNSTPLRIKGDKYAVNGLDASGYAEVDMPEDTITYSTGSNRGRSGTNTRTGITIGKSPKGKKVSRPETNREANNRVDKSYIAHWTPGDMFEVATPDFAISNAIASATLGKDYKPVMSSSGLNPFGYVEDISKTLNGNTNSAVNLGLRGLSTWTYAGAPGMSEGADYLATRFAPNMAKSAKSMKYIPKGGTNSGRLNSWNINSLSSGTGGRGVSEFGHRSMQRAINEGAVSGVGNGAATRWGTNAAQNANTGTTYIFRGNPNAYDKVADLVVSMTPWAAYAESEAALTANGISKRK